MSEGVFLLQEMERLLGKSRTCTYSSISMRARDVSCDPFKCVCSVLPGGFVYFCVSGGCFSIDRRLWFI